jgi:hypothetical protein
MAFTVSSVAKHCTTCTCDGAPPESEERIKQKKLYSGVPNGCLDYRDGRYCGKVVFRGDRCLEHAKKSGPSTRTGV